MTWPLSQDYNEAIQDPASSFSDAELKTGEAVANALGIPMPRSGNFADVYEVRCPSGSRWAVKCFTRQVSGLAERYSEISKYLHQANLPFMVDFKYLDQGIRVRGQWYPILKMQWVEGFVLNEFVRDNLDKKPILQALGQIWLRMARRLRESYIAHCDLQHGNVMFVPGSKSSSLAVKLIDYDGMCVPSLLGTKSGEVGHPAYQHPERLRSGAYDQEVDRFSLLSIGTALRCLSIGGRPLWERYDNGDNLLFRQSDLQAPAESPLFQELMAIGDPHAEKLVTELFRACKAPLAAVPLLTDLIPEEKPSGKVTKTVSASSAVAPPASGVPGPDWDFGAEEPAPSVVKKRYKKSGMSMWAWGAMGGAAALLLVCVGVGLSLFLRKEPVENAATPRAHNKPETHLSKPKATSPTAKEVAQRPDKVENPPPSSDPTRQRGPDENVSASILCLTPAGDKLAVSDSGDKDWRLLDSRTHQLSHRFSGHAGAVNGVAFSADGRRAVTSDADGMVHLWDVQTGQMISTRKPPRQPILSLALSPNGNKMVYTNGSNHVEVWDFDSKRGHVYQNNHKVLSVAFSPDGRYLICGYEQNDKPQEPVLFLWPLVGEARVRLFHAPPKAVTCIAISPNGKYIAAGRSGDPSEIAIWDFDSKNPPRIMRLSERSAVRQVLFSPDSRMILSACGTSIMLFRVNGSFLRSYSSRDPRITAAFSPDGKQVLHASHHQGKILHGAFQVPGERITQPTPPPAVVGNPPTDPDGDCKFQEAVGKLTITVPAKPHELNIANGRMNSPRLLRAIEGDFTVQVRVGGDFTPGTTPTNGGRFSWIGAGLLLWADENTYLRLERAGWYERKPSTLYVNWEVRETSKFRDVKHNFPSLSTAETYLRLERRGKQILASYSEDGQNWRDVKPLDIELPAKIKIGILAGSTSGQPFAPTFDQFRIKQGQGAMVDVAWPALPTGGAVVVAPSPKPPVRTVRRRERQPVPEAAAVEAAVKAIRASHKDDYANGKTSSLYSALFKEDNEARSDPVRHFAYLRELRDIMAESNVRGGLGQGLRMAQEFDVSLLEMKCAAVEMSLRSERQSHDSLAVTLPLVDEAIGTEQYEILARLVKALRISAGRLRLDDALRLPADRVLVQAEKVNKEHDKLKSSLTVLENDADNAKASLEVGKFHCIWRGDWEQALPLLARGGDGLLKSLIDKDRSNPDDAEEQTALGAAWRKHASQVNSQLFKDACQKRSFYWYQLAAAQLKGAKLKSVEQAMKVLARAVPELQNPWWSFGVYSGATVDAATGYLRILPPNGIATRASYQGALDITVVARVMKTDLNIDIGQGGRLRIGEDFIRKGNQLQVHRPDFPAAIGSRADERPITLPASSSFTVRWQISATGMKVWLDGKMLFEETREYDRRMKSPVVIHCGGAPIELKSVLVKAPAKK